MPDLQFQWECARKTYEDNLKNSNESTYKNIRNLKRDINIHLFIIIIVILLVIIVLIILPIVYHNWTNLSINLIVLALYIVYLYNNNRYSEKNTILDSEKDRVKKDLEVKCKEELIEKNKKERVERERAEKERVEKTKDTKKVPAQDIEEQERLQKIAQREKERVEKTKDTKKVPAQDIEEQERLQKIAQREKERVEIETDAIKETKDNVDRVIKTITDERLLEEALIKEFKKASYYWDVGVAFNNYISENKYIPENIKKKLAGIAEEDYTNRLH